MPPASHVVPPTCRALSCSARSHTERSNCYPGCNHGPDSISSTIARPVRAYLVPRLVQDVRCGTPFDRAQDRLHERRDTCTWRIWRAPRVLVYGPGNARTRQQTMADMSHVYIEDIGQYDGQTVTLKGWLYNKRSSGKLHFLQLRDGTGVLQCVVFKNDVTPEQFSLADHITQESSLLVTGTVRADQRAPLGYELSVKDLQLVQLAEPYPITPKEHGVAFLLDNRHLWLRSARQHAILRVRSAIIRACRDYFDGKGFTLLDAPIFTPAACEGTTTLFATDYFGEPAYLTQSGQLYIEAGAAAFGKVYCFGPTFRAEKSKTRRHLTEFWMIEPEVAYMDLVGDMDLAEDFIEYIVQRTLRERRRELETLERDTAALERVHKPFPRITYSEAIDRLQEQGFALQWGA